MTITAENWHYHIDPKLLADVLEPIVDQAFAKKDIPVALADEFIGYLKDDHYEEIHEKHTADEEIDPAYAPSPNNPFGWGREKDIMALGMASIAGTNSVTMRDGTMQAEHINQALLILKEIEDRMRTYAANMLTPRPVEGSTELKATIDTAEELVSMMNTRDKASGRPGRIWQGVGLQNLVSNVGPGGPGGGNT